MAKRAVPVYIRSSVTHTTVTRDSSFKDLPVWLTRLDVSAFLGISLTDADDLIQGLPHYYFGDNCRISKHQLAPDAPFRKAARAAIRQLLRDPTHPNHKLVEQEVRRFFGARSCKAHRGSA
jgi:hypothetical protein